MRRGVHLGRPCLAPGQGTRPTTADCRPRALTRRWIAPSLIMLLAGLEFWLRAAAAAEPVLLKQPGWIPGLAFSADGKRLATACSDQAARLRDAMSGKELALFRGHRDCVVAVALAPDGKTLGTGSYDQTARLWNVASARLLFTLEGHRGAVMSVAFSPDGHRLASASLDATVKLWDTASGELRTTFRGHKSWVNSVVFTHDGAELISGSSDGTVKIWDVRTGREKATWDTGDAEVRSVAVSPNGKLLAAGLRYGMVKLWSGGHERLRFKGHDGDAWSVTFSPEGGVLISGGGDWNKPGEVKLWNARTGDLVATFPQSGEVLSVACSADRQRLAAGTGDHTLKIWDGAAARVASDFTRGKSLLTLPK